MYHGMSGHVLLPFDRFSVFVISGFPSVSDVNRVNLSARPLYSLGLQDLLPAASPLLRGVIQCQRCQLDKLF